MDELETPSEEFMKDFNAGYMLAQHRPEIAAQIHKLELTRDRAGIKDGINQYYADKEKDRPSWLKPPPQPGKEKDMGRDMD
jgi:hypothetical protein